MIYYTLLHVQFSQPTRSVNNTVEDNNPNLAAEEASIATTPSPPENQTITSSISQQRPGKIFLQKAMIPILANGESTFCRELLDSGSQSNLITDNLVKRLGLPLQKHQTRIFGLGAKDELHLQGTTDFLLTPKNETAIPVRTFVMSKLTKVLPSSKVSTTGSISQTSDLPTGHSIYHHELTSFLEQSCTKQSCWMPESRKTTNSPTVILCSVGFSLEVRLQC